MPTPTHDDHSRPTTVYSRKGETVRKCMASPHCHNWVGKRHVDSNGFAMCPSCAEDFDMYAEQTDLDGASEVTGPGPGDPYFDAETTPANGR